jgi:hypothetical protein
MLTFALMTPIGTLASDFLPILNDYYTEITALVIGILFHFFHYHFESSEGHKSILPKFHDRFRDCIGFFIEKNFKS